MNKGILRHSHICVSVQRKKEKYRDSHDRKKLLLDGVKKMIPKSQSAESIKMMQAVNPSIVLHGKNWKVMSRRVIQSFSLK